jgi:hypothetical protein
MMHPKFVTPFVSLALSMAAMTQETSSEKSVVVDIREEEFPAENFPELSVDAKYLDPAMSTAPSSQDTDEEHAGGAASPEPELLQEEPARDADPGLAVRVEKLQNGHQDIDPKQVRVLAPFPAKLLARTPEGWRIEPSESAPHFTREVELAPGKHIRLTVRPHVLVPDADGTSVFGINEPGYSPPLVYQQNATVGAILSTSVLQLDNDSAQMGKAIDQLQQLLVSLPKPVEAAPPTDIQPSETKRQR